MSIRRSSQDPSETETLPAAGTDPRGNTNHTPDEEGTEQQDKHGQRGDRPNLAFPKPWMLPLLTLLVLALALAVGHSQESSPPNPDPFNSSSCPLDVLKTYVTLLDTATEGAYEVRNIASELKDQDAQDIRDGAFLLGKELNKAGKMFEDMAKDYAHLVEEDMYKQFSKDGFNEEIIPALDGLVLTGENAMAIVESSKKLLHKIDGIGKNSIASVLRDWLDQLIELDISKPVHTLHDNLEGKVPNQAVGDLLGRAKEALLLYPGLTKASISVLTVSLAAILSALLWKKISTSWRYAVAAASILLAVGLSIYVVQSEETPMDRVHLIMQEKLMPIMHIKPDHLPMMNGTWKPMLKLQRSGETLHNYVETAHVDLAALVDISVAVNGKLVEVEKRQKGNMLTQNDQYGGIIADARSIGKEHRQYQVDVVIFLEEMQNLYMNIITDLQDATSLVGLIDSVENHMKKVLELERRQQRLNLGIIKITGDLRKLGLDVSGLEKSHEKWMAGSVMASGALLYCLLTFVAAPIAVPAAAMKTYEHLDHKNTLSELNEAVLEMRNFAESESDIVDQSPQVALLKKKLLELRSYMLGHPKQANKALSDRERSFYFKKAIDKAKEGIQDIEDVISMLKSLTA